MTFTDAADYILSRIEYDADADALLIVTLRRLAVLIANREDGPELLEGLLEAYYGELCDLRYREQLALVMRGRN